MKRVCALVAALIALCACSDWGGSGANTGADKPSGSDSPLNLDPDQGPTIGIKWENGPAVGMANVFLLAVSLPPQAAVQEITVTPWMSIHRHGSGNVQPVVAPLADSVGVYRVSNVFFVMSGPWDLKVFIRSGEDAGGTSKVTEHRLTFPVEVPAS